MAVTLRVALLARSRGPLSAPACGGIRRREG